MFVTRRSEEEGGGKEGKKKKTFMSGNRSSTCKVNNLPYLCEMSVSFIR